MVAHLDRMRNAPHARRSVSKETAASARKVVRALNARVLVRAGVKAKDKARGKAGVAVRAMAPARARAQATARSTVRARRRSSSAFSTSIAGQVARLPCQLIWSGHQELKHCPSRTAFPEKQFPAVGADDFPCQAQAETNTFNPSSP